MRWVQKQDLLYENLGCITVNELNPNAQRLLEYIQQNPSCHLRKIKKDLGLSMGTTQYHLNILEKMGRVTSERHSLYRMYYPAGVFESNQKQILKVLTQETTRDILLFIIEMKNPTQTEIADRIKVSAASANWHIQKLIKLDLINETRDGKYKRYSMIGKSDQIVELIKNYQPKIWQRWSDRIVEMFLSMEVGGKNDSD